jgi:hypothetical protein
MSKRTYIPFLRQKLDVLLKQDPVISTQKSLAAQLQVDAAAISRWMSGQEYSREGKDFVPTKHLEGIAKIFAIDRDWLEQDKAESESVQDFQRRLASELLGRRSLNDWRAVFNAAELSEDLALVQASNVRPVKRGLAPVELPEELSDHQFEVGDRVYVALRLRDGWTPGDSANTVHVVVLLLSGNEIQSLQPSILFGNRETKVDQAQVTIPRTAPEQTLEITGPSGVQSLLAFISKDPIPNKLRDELMQLDHPDVRDCLEKIAVDFQGRPTSSWKVIKNRYFVHDRL